MIKLFLIELFGFQLAFSAILIRNYFPDIEIHNRELQRYNMANYFYGDSLNYSTSPNKHIHFEKSHKICDVKFDGHISHTFMLDPTSDNMPQILLVLYPNFTITKYQMDDACAPTFLSVDMQEKLKISLIQIQTTRSLFAFHKGANDFQSIVYFTGKKEKTENIGEYVMLFEWKKDDVVKLLAVVPAGVLANATLLVIDDLLFVYYKCIDRSTCSTPPEKNAVYGYLLKCQNTINDLGPYLIAKLDSEFFKTDSLMISDITVYKDCLLISNIAKDVVYQVRLSFSDRMLIFVRNFKFSTRVESLAINKQNKDLFYVASRLNHKRNAEIYEMVNGSISDIYYDYSAGDGSHEIINNRSSYKIAYSCTTQHFHFTSIYNEHSRNEHYIRIVSFSNKYLNICPLLIGFYYLIALYLITIMC